MRRAFETTSQLDKFYNYPHKSYPTIHVSGTNGKGSTSSMLASILIECGYKVGLFNTPSIKSLNDMIKINGKPMPRDEYDSLYKEVNNLAIENKIPVIRSGILAEVAFIYFQREKVDIAVIESDLGAATDSTGVLHPIVSVLTNISPDHLNLFGNDFLKYAEEKVGVIKPNTPIYVGETPTNSDVKQILLDKVNECNSKLILTDDENNNFIYEQVGLGSYKTAFGSFKTILGGDYQKANINLALNVINELRQQGYGITNDNIISGFEHIYENTGLCGRWHILNEEPRIILDCGHNINAWEKIVPQLENMDYTHLYMVLQMCNDKDIKSISQILPDSENITYIYPDSLIKRLTKPSNLLNKTKWMKASKRYSANSLISTLNKLCNEVNKDDVIFICGTCKNISQVIDTIKNIKIKKEWQ